MAWPSVCVWYFVSLGADACPPPKTSEMTDKTSVISHKTFAQIINNNGRGVKMWLHCMTLKGTWDHIKCHVLCVSVFCLLQRKWIFLFSSFQLHTYFHSSSFLCYPSPTSRTYRYIQHSSYRIQHYTSNHSIPFHPIKYINETWRHCIKLNAHTQTATRRRRQWRLRRRSTTTTPMLETTTMTTSTTIRSKKVQL